MENASVEPTTDRAADLKIDRNTERFWDQLIDLIEAERAIPVIGPELLLCEIKGQQTYLYDYLAEQLAQRLQVNFESGDTLNTVACRFLLEGGQREDIYPELKRVMPQQSEIQLPEALIKLAEIPLLKLFVTTSFDPLLEYALNQVRYGGQQKTQVLAFSPESNQDLTEPLEQLDRATVYHLFGKLTVVPEYAVTDEDILEFMHALQSKTNRPEKLFDALIKQNLVMIGCTFTNWLGHFFIRLGKKDRLIIPTSKMEYMAGDQLQQDKSLTDFLHHFSKRTRIFPVNAIAFVDELHHRWMERHPPEAQNATEPTSQTDLQDPDIERMENGAVFLSYASEDRPIVTAIRDKLWQAGIDVWFDRNPDALRVGEQFADIIKHNINQCSLFIPIISQHTLTPKPRFFRTEWNHALNIAAQLPPNKRFILPVVIDETPPDQLEIPDHFRDTHWERIADGQMPDRFVNEIKTLYREHQRE